MKKGRKNISARTKSIKEKNDCFYRNLEMLNILFYVGKGFMLRKQLFILIRSFYKINEHTANDMLSDLLQHGLVIKKQATDTQTCLYILTKFPLTQYKEGCCNTRDATSIKLNNRKIWNNIYRTEFIIREAIPMMEKLNISLELQNLFDFLHNYNITIYTSENQISVYQLYKSLYEKFPIKDIEAIRNQRPIESAFMNDYYKADAELYNYQCNFLGYSPDEEFAYLLEMKAKLEREKDLLSSPKELKKFYYNLFNMTAAGFFFIGLPDEDGNIILGTFDKCNNMYLKKIYENAICIALMLERYLGYFPHVTLQVYMSDADNLLSLRKREDEKGYDYIKQEMSNISKREVFFKNYKIPEQYWDFIQVDYIYYPLREKYNL